MRSWAMARVCRYLVILTSLPESAREYEGKMRRKVVKGQVHLHSSSKRYYAYATYLWKVW